MGGNGAGGSLIRPKLAPMCFVYLMIPLLISACLIWCWYSLSDRSHAQKQQECAGSQSEVGAHITAG